MSLSTPFAEMPSTPEPIIAQVRRLLAEDVPQDMMVETTVLDSVADHAVRELWDSRIKTFVPVLALRQAREVLQEQDRLIMPEHAAVGASQAATTSAPRDERPVQDVLTIPDDVLPLDERDVLPM